VTCYTDFLQLVTDGTVVFLVLTLVRPLMPGMVHFGSKQAGKGYSGIFVEISRGYR
jgi:hypothetical protein